jgi:hypothetical protein
VEAGVLDEEAKQQFDEIFVASILISFYFPGLLWVLATTRKAKRQ